MITGAALIAPYNSAGTTIDLGSNVTGVWTSMGVGMAPRHGSVTVSGSVFTSVPTPRFYGPDSFTFTATHTNGTSSAATVSVTVGNPPPPTATNATMAVPYNSSGTALALTSKITGVATSMAITSGPGRGTATASGSVVTYIPNAGYSGADSFAYTATGPGGTGVLPCCSAGLYIAGLGAEWLRVVGYRPGARLWHRLGRNASVGRA